MHAFNKSERHLEFSRNDFIRGKIIHVAKMATIVDSSVDADFAVCSHKKECFYGYVIVTRIKVFVQRYSWIDAIEGKRELI